MSRHFLSMQDITGKEILELYALAAAMKRSPADYASSLKGKTLALIFEKPSLRTRTSFDVGIQQLGGFSIAILPQEISLGKRESVYDVVKNLERMVQGIMVRTFAHNIVQEMARHSAVPIINGLTDSAHPCQALADYFTIQEVRNSLQGLNLCFVGDGNNVAHSLMIGGARLGVNVTVACPVGYEPQPSAVEQALNDARSTNSTIQVIHDPYEGAKGADVVYTDVWASMGQEAEAEERKKTFRPFQVNRDLMAQAKKDAIFMHCLPAHRGEEVTDEVMDAPQSVVFQQAENRLHVQKALMYQLMK